MRKRVRKKLRLGEFVELGFSLDLTFKPDTNTSEMDAFLDRFIEICEKNNLLSGGGIVFREKSFSMFCSSSLYRGKSKKYVYSVTESQRQEIKSWVESQKEVDKFNIGNLKDSWRVLEVFT